MTCMRFLSVRVLSLILVAQPKRKCILLAEMGDPFKILDCSIPITVKPRETSFVEPSHFSSLIPPKSNKSVAHLNIIPFITSSSSKGDFSGDLHYAVNQSHFKMFIGVTQDFGARRTMGWLLRFGENL